MNTLSQLHKQFEKLTENGEWHYVKLIDGIYFHCRIAWETGTECDMKLADVINRKKSRANEIIWGFMANGLHEDDIYDFCKTALKKRMAAYDKRIKKYMADCLEFYKGND